MSCACGSEQVTGRGMCHTHYAAFRRRQIAYGRWNPRVPAEAVRAHIETMRAAGVSPNQLAQLAGVSQSTLSQILSAGSDKQVAAWVQTSVLAVPVPERAAEVTTDTARVPILGARRRFQALVASGYTATHLARELGTARQSRTIRSLMGHRIAAGQAPETIAARRERSVKELFDQLQLIPGPSRQARELGERNGWPLPLEWDEQALDDPNGRPIKARWTPESARAERRARVAELTARGLTGNEIAHELGINVRLVERDRAHTREHAEIVAREQVSPDIAAMTQVAVQARQDLAARRSPQARGLERTR